ncbi:CbrC family protein [Microbacterium testaceum]|uniref:CbrC family protein n=1 Tax=Microbacterium testaceum TaxID=2033 RepID=UPI00382FCCDA
MSDPIPPTFRFHPNAYALGMFENTVGVCNACGQVRPMRYTSVLYSAHDVDYICPWCIADGTAARVFDGVLNSFEGIEGVPRGEALPLGVDLDEAREVSERTPSYRSWQEEEWRSHCGRPCAFVGDIGSAGLGAYLDEPDFAADVHSGQGWEPAVLRRYLRAGGDLAGYLFQCLTCGAHRLHVDAS